MKVLFCGPYSPVLRFLCKIEDEVSEHDEHDYDWPTGFDLIVSHGWRSIISPDVLATTPAVNLHIGYLPWNRGAHPNFWSAYEGTPGGVTVHWMDEGIDTGPIIAQQRVEPEPGDTLRSSYDRLQREVTELFVKWWPMIREGSVNGRPQTAPRGYTPGSEHHAADLPNLPNGWNTPVSEIAGSGIEGARRLVCH